jgi:hypothetical protein
MSPPNDPVGDAKTMLFTMREAHLAFWSGPGIQLLADLALGLSPKGRREALFGFLIDFNILWGLSWANLFDPNRFFGVVRFSLERRASSWGGEGHQAVGSRGAPSPQTPLL